MLAFGVTQPLFLFAVCTVCSGLQTSLLDVLSGRRGRRGVRGQLRINGHLVSPAKVGAVSSGGTGSATRRPFPRMPAWAVSTMHACMPDALCTLPPSACWHAPMFRRGVADNDDVAPPPPHSQIRSVTGYVAQDDVLPGTLSTLEYLAFNALLRMPPHK